MSWNLTDVSWLIATQWLQLSIAGVAIFHGLSECYKEWQARRAPRVSMYGRKAVAPHGMPSLVKAA